jgi:pyruvate formate lyase activating enzyme
MMRFSISRRLEGRCRDCGFCTLMISCPGESNCTGCGACVAACPHSARELQEVEEKRKSVRIEIDGRSLEVPSRVTVLKALEFAGYGISKLPGEGDIFAPCRTGGCWSCAVAVNGELRPSCITPVEEGMRVMVERGAVSELGVRRLVSGFQGHPVGGVGTPHWLKPRGLAFVYIEVACFAHGCILRCPTCQNWEITYSSVEEPLTPRQAARLMTRARRDYRVDRMAISGGEPTLNREWLLEYFRRLRELNPDGKARIHLDTNAVLLSRDYIEELVEAGVTDLGIDVKGLELETFVRITGIRDRELAKRLMRTEWDAVKYLLDRHREKVFIGIGIPYNPKLLSLDEVRRLGERIAGWDPEVQVCSLDYRPEFRRQDILKPTYEEMVEVKRTLESTGLKCVLCQTERGHVGPGPV